MKKIISVMATMAAFAVCAATQVFRLELDTDTNVTWLRGADGVERPVEILSPEEYAMLTNGVENTWRKLNETEAGRLALHGRIVNHEVDGTNRMIRADIYADGYRYEVAIPRKKYAGQRAMLKAKRESAEKSGPDVRPGRMSDRRWSMLQKIEENRKKRAKTVTVVHDAATGTDEYTSDCPICGLTDGYTSRCPIDKIKMSEDVVRMMCGVTVTPMRIEHTINWSGDIPLNEIKLPKEEVYRIAIMGNKGE